MLVGYMRVSKADGSQTVDLQRDALLAAGVDADHLYDDHASGRRDDRPGLAACLKALRADDTLVVWKLDRLGRNLHHLINTVHDLTVRGVGLKVLTGQGTTVFRLPLNNREAPEEAAVFHMLSRLSRPPGGSRRLSQGAPRRRHARRLEARPARPQPPPPHQHRPRPHPLTRRKQRADHPGPDRSEQETADRRRCRPAGAPHSIT
jgi:hypothetical protein